MTNRFTGRVIAITGAGRGIGAATAEALTREGARVAIGDIDLDVAKATAERIGGDTLALPLAVTSAESVADFLDPVETSLGPIDVYVNVASTAGKAGIAGSATYSASKAAVIQYTEGAYAELHPHGLDFSVVMPGITRTELTAGVEDMPGFRAITPESVAEAIVDAVARPRFEVYVPRSARPLLNLTRMLPHGASQWLARRMGVDHVFLDALDRPERSSYEARAKGGER